MLMSFLKKLAEQTRNKVMHIVIVTLLVISSAGCSSWMGEFNKETSFKSTGGSVLETEGALPKAAKLEAPTMYQILAAEMMASRGYVVQAYNIIYRLAVRTKDVGLARRAFQLSMKTFNENKIETSLALWKTLAPMSKDVWRATFLMSLRRNEVDLALQAWQKYHQFSKKGLEADLRLAAQRSFLSVPEVTELYFLQKLTKIYPLEWASHFGLAMVANIYGKTEVASKAIKEARVLQTKVSEQVINHLLAKIYLQVTPPEKGLQELKPYIEKNPKDWFVQEIVARLEVQAGRYDSAIERYQTILQFEPDAHASRLSLALVQIERKNYKVAKENLQKLVTQKGYAQVANYYLGMLHQKLGKQNIALINFEKVTFAPYYIEAQLHRAEIYFVQKKMVQAYDVLKSTKVIKPEDKLRIYQVRGIFLTHENKVDAALEQYNKVLRIDPNHVEVLMSQALLYYKTEDFTAYEANLKRILLINPVEADSLNALGYFYVEKDINFEQAEVLLKRALSLKPDSYYIWDSLGWLYYKKGNYKLARVFLEDALEVEYDDEVLIHLISTYWKMGDKSLSKELWHESHKKFLQNKRLQGLIEHLKSK